MAASANGQTTTEQDPTERVDTLPAEGGPEAAEAEGRRFRILVEHIPMVVSYMDLVIVNNPGHSIPLYISPQIEDLLGYPREEWLSEGELWLEVLHPDDAERMREADETARRTLTPLSAEYRMIARDGSIVWVSEKAAVVADPRSGTQYWQGVMVDITERKRAEERVEALLEKDRHRQRERAMLLDRTLRAAEEERIRLAGEIHDGPVQRMARMVYVLERIQMKLTGGELEVADQLLLDLQGRVMREVLQLRETMVRLRPPALDELGLVAALKDRARELQEGSGVAVSVEASLGGRLSPELETVLYRVAQEAMGNVAKHAHASSVRLRLVNSDARVVLEVIDDGDGFDPSRKKAEAAHFGLMAMRERVEMAGGDWSLASSPGQGTTVRAAFAMDDGAPR